MLRLDKEEKRGLSESDICDLFITPAIKAAGWDQMTQMRREVTLTPGPVVVRGNVASRNTNKKKFADYVLQKSSGIPIAIVEAKEIPIPIPCLDEQRRIIRTVDKLLDVCGELRVALGESQQTQLHLADVVTEQAFH